MNSLESKDLNLYYGDFHALKGITMGMKKNEVTAFIGPSGCGKSTYLRCFNRMNDLIDNVRIEGQVLVDGVDIYQKNILVDDLRTHVGMVFQKPNPFPKSIFENVAYGLRVNGSKDNKLIAERVENFAETGCPLGRSKRQTEEIGVRTFGRAAAASLHCPRVSHRAFCTFNGRTGFGAGPDLYRQN